MTPFKDSKLKDICYHGTSSEYFTVLDKSKIQKNPEDGDSGYFGWGFYLTTDKNYAEEYGDTILAFYVNIQNPFDFTDIHSKDLVDFIFSDCKNLKLRVKETLRVINQIGREAFEFETANSKELLTKCMKLYANYKDKEVDDKFIDDVKDVLIELALDVNNWLNGLFFYFGRELFHYFTIHGYDGVITPGGKEVVVYETKQLKPISNLGEDLDFQIASLPDWKSGADAYTNRILDSLKSNSKVSNIRLSCKFYPERKESVWYEGEDTFLQFTYDNKIEVSFYVGGDLEIYRYDNDEHPILSVDDLEADFIWNDKQYYDFLRDGDKLSNGLCDNNTVYFGFILSLEAKDNIRDTDFYGYELGYEDSYNLDEVFAERGNPLGWLFDNCIPEFIQEHPEYFSENDIEEDFDLENNSKVKEKVSSKVKHVTKGQILKDVIHTFGYVDVESLSDAVYLLPNGKILDTKGDSDKSQHENVANYISAKYKMDDLDENQGSKLMQDLGVMRITPWIPALFIPERLTEKQEDTLYNILVKLSSKISKDSPLMVSTSNGDRQIQFEHIDNPEEVITSILGYYVFGVLKA